MSSSSAGLGALRAIHAHTKSAAVQILLSLQASGALVGNDDGATLKRKMKTSTEMDAKTMTPYGPVVQEIQLNAPGMAKWEICHPFAYLWHLTSISEGFRSVMKAITAETRELRLVIYADSLIPGNPFRPEKSRTLMCVYWAIVDWPGWMLARTFAWPCFSIIRTSILEGIPGAMSYLARVILRVFFPTSGDSMANGIMIQSPDGPLLVKCRFVGWLADLVGHKELTHIKGTSGNSCCLDCTNLHKGVKGRGQNTNGLIGLACSDRRQFDRRSDADLFVTLDYMTQQHAAVTQKEFEILETRLGINYVPEGILFDASLRSLYLPVSHMIRDWQHTMAQDGAANVCVGSVLTLLAECGYSLQHVRSFMMLCSLPSKYGKPHPSWLGDNRLKHSVLQSFSGILLNIVPIIFLFLEKFCTDNTDLSTDAVRCFKLMHVICGVFASGAEEAPKHADRLRHMLEEYHRLAVSLDFPMRPKTHHMHHIIDGMVWLGKLLSCFVCERKHRTVKDSALHVFRYLEHTVLHDVICKQCTQMRGEDTDLFKEQFLVHRRQVAGAPEGCCRSRHAVLKFGSTHTDDVVWLCDGRCGRVSMFYDVCGIIMVGVLIYVNAVDRSSQLSAAFDERQCAETFIDPHDILDAVTWYYDAPSIVRVAIPPLYTLQGGCITL